ncbi:hypothetical protein [Nostoc sp.]|uniref:hypothetical protein n=1 Tax=Nostoc sp. TaxID=1180 RepID=UPI002FFA43C3
MPNQWASGEATLTSASTVTELSNISSTVLDSGKKKYSQSSSYVRVSVSLSQELELVNR